MKGAGSSTVYLDISSGGSLSSLSTFSTSCNATNHSVVIYHTIKIPYCAPQLVLTLSPEPFPLLPSDQFRSQAHIFSFYYTAPNFQVLSSNVLSNFQVLSTIPVVNFCITIYPKFGVGSKNHWRPS